MEDNKLTSSSSLLETDAAKAHRELLENAKALNTVLPPNQPHNSGAPDDNAGASDGEEDSESHAGQKRSRGKGKERPDHAMSHSKEAGSRIKKAKSTPEVDKLKTLAEKKDAEAQYKLAVILEKGIKGEVRANRRQALKLYGQAAAQGYSDARARHDRLQNKIEQEKSKRQLKNTTDSSYLSETAALPTASVQNSSSAAVVKSQSGAAKEKLERKLPEKAEKVVESIPRSIFDGDEQFTASQHNLEKKREVSSNLPDNTLISGANASVIPSSVESVQSSFLSAVGKGQLEAAKAILDRSVDKAEELIGKIPVNSPQSYAVVAALKNYVQEKKGVKSSSSMPDSGFPHLSQIPEWPPLHSSSRVSQSQPTAAQLPTQTPTQISTSNQEPPWGWGRTLPGDQQPLPSRYGYQAGGYYQPTLRGSRPAGFISSNAYPLTTAVYPNTPMQTPRNNYPQSVYGNRGPTFFSGQQNAPGGFVNSSSSSTAPAVNNKLKF
jgi:TPR repeat protein